MGKKSRGSAVSIDGRNKKKVDDAHTNPADTKPHDSSGTTFPRILSTAILTTVMPSILTGVARFLGTSSSFRSEIEGDRPYFPLRLIMCILLDATYCGGFYALLLPPARALARTLPGSSVPTDDAGCERQESEQNDPTLVWPVPGTDLPPDWRQRGQQQQQPQPYFLNHVRGSTRIRHATYRTAAALGTVAMVTAMSRYVDRAPLRDIGLELIPIDLARGFAVGTGVIVALFVAEVCLGWLRIVGYGEVVAPGESLPVNLAWDVLFHVGVCINEEVSMRGWILVNTARYAAALGTSPSTAMIVSVSLQSGLFALMHFGSPGASRVGLINLVVGGTAAALNVFLSGGLSFSLGWHFGWNITMGHLLGLSTSGIPMSAKLVSVVPHPKKAHLHGGRFGPEQSPLAPAAYLLGCIALVYFYGTEGLGLWSERLSSPALTA